MDLLLAARASHECKGDFERVPAVLEKLKYTVCMEDVAASELHASLFFELAREADGAKFATFAIAV